MDSRELSMEDDDIRLPDGYQARVKGIWYVFYVAGNIGT